MRRPEVSKLLERVEQMPELRHSIPDLQRFDLMQSEVVQWLSCEPGAMQWLFNTLQKRGLIVYDSDRRIWKWRKA